MKKSRKKGFSLAEVIISMTLIILVSGSGLMASHIAVAARINREQNVNVWSMASSVYSALSDARFSCTNIPEAQKMDVFLNRFNTDLAFILAVNSYVQEFDEQNPRGIKKESWKISANNSVTVKDEDLDVIDPLLKISHNNVVTRGNPYSYIFEYEQSMYSLEFKLTLIGNTWHYRLSAKTSKSYVPMYTFTEEFEL